jgi:ActR/RegA family two-component response regulator
MGKTMVHSMNDNNPLSGVNVLVVEDDLFLAMALEDTLVGMGAVVVDMCHTLDEAMTRADADDFAVAVLDFSLGSHSVTPLARRLARRNVPSFSIQACRAANQACRSGGSNKKRVGPASLR